MTLKPEFRGSSPSSGNTNSEVLGISLHLHRKGEAGVLGKQRRFGMAVV